MSPSYKYSSPTLNYIYNLCVIHILHQAVENGDINKIKLLLNKGYNINARDQDGNTPLFCAIVMDGSDISIVELLVQSGANINKQDKDGNTPLFFAIAKNNFNIVQFLIKNGAHVDTKNKDGNTPLSYAIKVKNHNIIEFLVQKGANINAQDKEGKTYLHKTSDWQLAELLKSLGARSDIKDQNGKTACDYAAENGNYKLLDILSPEQPLLHSEQADQDESDLIGVDDMCEKFGEPAGNF